MRPYISKLVHDHLIEFSVWFKKNDILHQSTKTANIESISAVKIWILKIQPIGHERVLIWEASVLKWKVNLRNGELQVISRIGLIMLRSLVRGNSLVREVRELWNNTGWQPLCATTTPASIPGGVWELYVHAWMPGDVFRHAKSTIHVSASRMATD